MKALAVRWIILIVLAAGAGFLAQLGHVPGSWMIGPLVVAILFGIVFHKAEPMRLPKQALIVCQALIGAVLAGAFRPSVVPELLTYGVPILCVSILTLVASVAAGLLLARYSTMDSSTATLGTLPGGASSMIAMSAELGADAKMVAVMQLLRLIFAILSAAGAAFFLGNTGQVPGSPFHPSLNHPWTDYVLTLCTAALGASVGLWIRLPAGALLGPLTLCLVAQSFSIFHPALPLPLPQAAYIMLGLYVGLLFDRPSLKNAGKLLPIIVLNVGILLFVCAGLGELLALLVGASFLSGLLATTPGGMDSVAAIALGSGVDISFVLAVQTARFLMIVFLGPVLARFVLRKRTY